MAVHLGGISQTGREIDYSTGLIGNYVGYVYDDVVEAATANGITLEIINTSNEANGEELSDDTIGKILEQSPAAGSSVEDSDGTIQVVVSAGTKKVKVGDYVGYSFEDAQQTAEDKHINLTEETMTEDAAETADTVSNIIPGYVLTQSVESGEKVPKDSTMTVTVSSGNILSIDINTTFSMPSLIGKTFAEALETAEKKGFYIGIEGHEYSTTQKAGTICAQSVKSKTTVGGGTEVLLTISDGPEQMTVPDVVGKELEAARTALSAQKLEVSVDYAYNDDYGSQYSSGQVMTQSIDGGETVDEGTTITLIVSQGSKPVATTSQKKSTSGSSSSGSSSGSSSSGSSSKKSSSSDDSIDYDSLDRVN
ncbi:MAG: PASTA domain-containing protein [Clostridiales bacterium]|nr:PASTA domain-containing protein [Clostridiales bacterium]